MKTKDINPIFLILWGIIVSLFCAILFSGESQPNKKTNVVRTKYAIYELVRVGQYCCVGKRNGIWCEKTNDTCELGSEK